MKAITLAIGVILVIIIIALLINSSSSTIEVYKYPNRYSVYDYRHGYTYRTVDEYKEIRVIEERNSSL